MKNYNQFINNQNDKLNEEIVGKFFRKIGDNISKFLGNTPGGKEVEKIYSEYKTKIENQIKEIMGVDLQASSAKNESFLLKYNSFLNEDVGQPTKENEKVLTRDALLKKSKILNQKLDILLKEANKKMDAVLKKKGGAEKNEKLSELIELKKDTLKMDFLNMQLEYIEKSGDKSLIKDAEEKRKELNKKIENRYNKINSMGEKTDKDEKDNLKIGNRYQYKTEDGIKNIEIVSEGEKEGTVIAKYLHPDDGKIEPQPFTISNIVTKPEIKKGTYKYRSKEGTGDLIDVKVENTDIIDGKIEVTSVETGKSFKVDINLLRDE